MANKKRLGKYKKDNKDLIEDTIRLNKQKTEEENMANIKDDDLFVINEGKSEDIKKNRQKLEADRFKQYNKERSRHERDKIKELIKKKPTTPKEEKPKPKANNLFDIWNTPEEQIGMKKISKNRVRDREILTRSKDNIRRVVVPQSGISYNPPAVEHKKVIEQVVVEEIEDIRKEKQLEEELNPALRPEIQTLPEQIAELKEYCKKKSAKYSKSTDVANSESEEDEEGPTRLSVNPPVDRSNALTPRERKRRELHKQMLKEHQRIKKQKKEAWENRPVGKKKLKAMQKIKNYNKKMDEIEKERWEAEGVVSKPRKLGLYKYQKPKTDFVPEEELPESFRTQKGSDSLVRDHFDSIYRRNLLPKEAPPNDRKKIKEREYKLHSTNTEKRMKREQEKKGDRAMQLARERLRERKRQTALIRGLRAPKETKVDDDELIFI